jgi:hypothetical protein
MYTTLQNRRLRDLIVALQAGNVAEVSVFADRLANDPAMPHWPHDIEINTLRYAYLLGRLSMAVDLGYDSIYRTTLRALAAQCKAAA